MLLFEVQQTREAALDIFTSDHSDYVSEGTRCLLRDPGVWHIIGRERVTDYDCGVNQQG